MMTAARSALRTVAAVAAVTLIAATGKAGAAPFEVTDEAELREAIASANSNGQDDIITFADDVSLITLAKELTIEMDLNDQMEPTALIISGALDGNDQRMVTIEQTVTGQRVFTIAPDTDVTIKNVIVAGGNLEAFGSTGGGILNGGTLTIENSEISGNHAFRGGGISNQSSGVLTINKSAVRDNDSDRFGGGIENLNALAITNSLIGGNVSAEELDGSTAGGGIVNDGSLIIISSTIRGNRALAKSSIGGGIFSAGGTVQLSFTTIAGNEAKGSGGGVAAISGTVGLKGTIIAGNIDNDCLNGSDLPDTLMSAGYNIDSDDSCALGEPTDQTVPFPPLDALLDPLLGPLIDNGGPTETMAIAAGGAAHDMVPTDEDGHCTDLDGVPVLTDQRGVSRPQGGGCDVGAFELVATAVGIKDIIELFDTLVQAYELDGVGAGRSADHRLNALRNMLLTAGDLIAQGEIDEACGQLLQVLRRMDGESEPPDFAEGSGTVELSGELEELQGVLGCVEAPS